MRHDCDGHHIDVHHLPHTLMRYKGEVLRVVVAKRHVIDWTRTRMEERGHACVKYCANI